MQCNAGEPCSRASLVMLGSITVIYIVLFLPQLRNCLALLPAVRALSDPNLCNMGLVLGDVQRGCRAGALMQHARVAAICAPAGPVLW